MSASSSTKQVNRRAERPIHAIRGDKTRSDLDHFRAIAVDLQELPQKYPHCMSLSGNADRPLKCSCLRIFENEFVTNCVAAFCVKFGHMDRHTQQLLIAQRIRDAQLADLPSENNHCIYSLPFLQPKLVFVGDDGNDDLVVPPLEGADGAAVATKHQVCQSALRTILGVGKQFWSRCKQAATTGELPQHGLKGATSNRQRNFNAEIHPDLVVFFDEIQKLADPVATGIVGEVTAAETNIGLLEKEKGELVLGPAFSKRKLYQRFCWERGHCIRYTANGTPVKEERTDEGWDRSKQRLQICAWNTFRLFWEKHYPHLHVQKTAEDIGGE
jgi:hypothetical protein